VATPSELPPVGTAELARRLGVSEAEWQDTLTASVTVAVQVLAGRCDVTRTTANLEAWEESVTALAMKVWDIGNHGLSADLGIDGEWATPTQAATSGLARSVYGTLAPCMPYGGVVVG